MAMSFSGISFPPGTPGTAKPGEEFAFSCGGYQSGYDVTIQMIKTDVDIRFVLKPGFSMSLGRQIVLSNDDVLEVYYTETGRYSISSGGDSPRIFVLTVAGKDTRMQK